MSTTGFLIDVEQAAQLLCVSVHTLRSDRHRKTLGVPYVALSERVVRYDPTDLRAWIDSRRRQPAVALPRKARRGRPTRVEEVQAAELGISVPQLRARGGA